MSQKFNPLSGNFDLVLDKASEIKFDNVASGLSATNLQSAVDQIEAQILALPNPITYKGTWDASTNTPTLANTDTGKEGFLYQVNVAGSVNFGAGAISFEVGDKVVSNGSVWNKWDMTDAVSSVNGQAGAVVLTTTDIAEGTNPYFTNERAQDAIGAALTATSTVTLSYNDPSNAITADVNDASITDAKLSTGINANKIGTGSVSNTTFAFLDATSSVQTQLNSKQATGNYVTALTGDVTATGPGSVAATLATVNSNVGTFGSASQSLTATANAKGLITAVSAQAIQITESQVTNLTTDLATKADKVAGDITKTSFTAANNVSTPTNVTGASFANATTRSFEMEVDVLLSATTPAYQHFTMRGIQRGSDWTMTQTTIGDNSGVVFSITTAGQLQYISANAAGFTSLTMSFKASTVGI